MNVGQLIRALMKHDQRSEVEIRIVVPGPNVDLDETYVTQTAGLITTRDHRNRVIVQVTNES